MRRAGRRWKEWGEVERGGSPERPNAMSEMLSEVLIVIPARLEARRLPRKPLAEIAGKPMIVHVWERALAANVGRVVVATDSAAIVAAIEAVGGEALLTRADHESGSDRIFEAAERLDWLGPERVIVNVQGDLPTLAPELIATAIAPLADSDVDIATLAAEIRDEGERTDPNVVKVVATELAEPGRLRRLRALYFTRATAPWGEGPLYHHIGIYAFRAPALRRFVALPPSPLERRERLEQLRALEAGMRIDVRIVDTVPLGVDTPADLARARRLLEAGGEVGDEPCDGPDSDH